MIDSSPSHRPSTTPARLRTIGALLCGLVLLVASCSSTPEPLDSAVIEQLDIANNALADLTTVTSEDVPRAEILDAVLRAQTAGTQLRVVVADPDGELVSAKSVVDRYGGTAISYQADRTAFEGASRDLSGGQLDRAVDAAKRELDIGDSASAFVDVIATEGLDARGTSVGRTLLWLALIPAALFLLSGAWSYVSARKRRAKRVREFADRKAVLMDWATQLGPEVDIIAPAIGGGAPDVQQSFSDTQGFVSTILPKLDEATSLGELDAAEMRIGRTAIKLRDIRRSLDV